MNAVKNPNTLSLVLKNNKCIEFMVDNGHTIALYVTMTMQGKFIIPI